MGQGRRPLRPRLRAAALALVPALPLAPVTALRVAALAGV